MNVVNSLITIHIMLVFFVKHGSLRQIQAFFNRNVGEYLVNNVIRTIQVHSEFECGVHCSRDTSCVSVNYKVFGENIGTCELNNCSLYGSEENRRKEIGFVNLRIFKPVCMMCTRACKKRLNLLGQISVEY